MRTHFAIVQVLYLATLLVNSYEVSLSALCQLDDSSCIKETARNFFPTFVGGISELNVETSDPLFIKRIDLTIPSLKLILSDIAITGLKDAELTEIRFYDNKTAIRIELQSSFMLEGYYDMDGELFVYPIKGRGPAHVTLRNMYVTIDARVDTMFRMDGSFWHYQYKNHTFDLRDKSDVVFENLFNGDATFGSLSSQLVANSGNDIINEVANPLVKAIIDILIVRVNEMCERIPLERLCL